ncbi:MAG: class I SAM-dependent methyltransferase [Rhodospirillaceae bacterium]|nr:class I SAM-dependent methyltransferase [Rhodospirillaceae bacterium]
MFQRRQFLMSSAAGAAAAISAFKASAKGLAFDVEPRGTTGILERLPRLDLESAQDFMTGYRVFINGPLNRAAIARAESILKANGLTAETPMSMADTIKLMAPDPEMMLYIHNWENTQRAMWATVQHEAHKNADAYTEEMDRAMKAGPGTIELDARLEPPAYTKHEIHIQPGGYVGDPFAGYIYLHGQNVVFTGGNFQDKAQVSLAGAVPTPASGKVRRVLEQGCSIGQLTMALKLRFPEAEVWGDDVAAPMLRYGQVLAVDRGIDVHFVQQLSEKSKFPNNHFDIVTNNLVFHEVTTEGARGIIAEAFRTLRPGGVFYPIDLFTGSPKPKTAYQQFKAWQDYRWNAEIWRMEYTALDMPEEMRKVGFIVNEKGPPARGGTDRNIMGTKPA